MCQEEDCKYQARTIKSLDAHYLQIHKTKYLLHCWINNCDALFDLKDEKAFILHGQIFHGKTFYIDDASYWDAMIAESLGQGKVEHSSTPTKSIRKNGEWLVDPDTYLWQPS